MNIIIFVNYRHIMLILGNESFTITRSTDDVDRTSEDHRQSMKLIKVVIDSIATNSNHIIKLYRLLTIWT